MNGSGGGATLLKDPELIYRGAKAARGGAGPSAGHGEGAPRWDLLQPQF